MKIIVLIIMDAPVMVIPGSSVDNLKIGTTVDDPSLPSKRARMIDDPNQDNVIWSGEERFYR